MLEKYVYCIPNKKIIKVKSVMHSGYKLLVTFGAKRRRSLGNVCKHRSMVSLFSIMDLMAVSGFSLNMLSMRKAVLSISGNVYKQQEMEIDTVLSEIESKYDFTFKGKQLTAISDSG
jgi:hypothetical protein